MSGDSVLSKKPKMIRYHLNIFYLNLSGSKYLITFAGLPTATA